MNLPTIEIAKVETDIYEKQMRSTEGITAK